MKKWTLVTVLAALFWVGAGVGAQEVKEAPTLTGRVVDGVTGTPLLGVFVHLLGEEWGVLTGEDGGFELPKVQHGILHLGAEQLGYKDLLRTVRFPSEDEVVLALSPDPILMEGIQVMTDRFERRLEAQATFSQVLRREKLLRSPGLNLLDVIALHTFVHPVPCYRQAIETTCAVIRGRMTPVKVYMDEMPVVGGLDFISMISPHELYRVEVFHSLGQIRVYTEGFMRWISQNKLALAPIGR